MSRRKVGFNERRRQLDEKYPQKSFRYVPKNLTVFGQDGKAVTIGVSRKPPPPPEDTPGPGAYDFDPKTLFIELPHIIQNRPETDYSTLTSKCDYPELTPFVRPNTTIHQRDNIRFFSLNDAPAPQYVPPSLMNKSVMIRPRITQRSYDCSPGPGYYTPTDSTRPRSAAFTVSRTKERELWEKPVDAPGPGQYEVLPKLSKPKRWAQKLRTPVSKHRPSRMTLEEEISTM